MRYLRSPVMLFLLAYAVLLAFILSPSSFGAARAAMSVVGH